ncbi:uncharacterized protein LOC110698327 [Chenopodium quinoa]|uniref:uncharacterized protein LOC110698327 n=1 Tax=Chenopodium quinoa TaxID=63459 RepID=UPI000B792BCC|nr:uncharacterized protein LOC110698327 [Chenopodium quinoa]
MSNLAKLEFVALDITRKNYLSWVLDAEIHLDAKGLGKTIKEANKATPQDKAKAMIFLRHHLHEGLKNEYLTVKNSQILWSNLRKEKKVLKYSELISCLLVAEKNNELLMKNHESCPTGSTPFPEANVTTHNGKETKNRDHSSSSGRGRGRGRGQWRGRGRGRGYGRGRGGKKGKKVEANLILEDGEGDFDFGNANQFDVGDFLTFPEGNNFDFDSTTHLEVADFFTAPEGNN